MAFDFSTLYSVLAYDATMLCFYGECLPSQYKFNFPAMAHLISVLDNLLVHLTIANIKVIIVDCD
jgi:hypothetical protein